MEEQPIDKDGQGSAAFQFYPTPPDLAAKAWAKFQNTDFARVLEPSAGEGALADACPDDDKYPGYSRRKKIVDCIEIDITRHPILREKGMEVVGVDFMQFENGAIYSHIIMNPPFAHGAAHALKAWDVIYDGELVIILNAETIRNPHTRERKFLVDLIEKHGSCEFIQAAFATEDAERKTDVEVALVHLVKKSAFDSDLVGDILETMTKDSMTASGLTSGFGEMNEVALSNSFIENAVVAFKAAVFASRKAFMATAQMNYYANYLGETMEMRTGRGTPDHFDTSLNSVRKALHEKYTELKNRAWAGILHSTNVMSKLSSSAQSRFEAQFEDIKKLEFSCANVYGFLQGLAENHTDMQMQTILDVFDIITMYHADNTVYFMGWKSNSKHRTCGMRIKMTRFILPGCKVESWQHHIPWDMEKQLADIDKVFALLDNKTEPETTMQWVFRHKIDELKAGQRMSSSYFDLRLYPGLGTIHFFPRRKELVDKLNRMTGAMRAWIPPSTTPADMFWQQYADAEKLDKEVRAEVHKNNLDRWSDPFWNLSRGSDKRDQASEAIGNAIGRVLERHGINVEIMLENNQEPEQLKLCA